MKTMATQSGNWLIAMLNNSKRRLLPSVLRMLHNYMIHYTQGPNLGRGGERVSKARGRFVKN